jgi:hypothetical protein
MENKIERMKMVKAMEFIARQVNNEEIFNVWLADGVGDGEIEYGDLNVTDREGYYCGGDGWERDEADKHFSELMDTFMWVMKEAWKDGGLYCDVYGGEKPHRE